LFRLKKKKKSLFFLGGGSPRGGDGAFPGWGGGGGGYRPHPSTGAKELRQGIQGTIEGSGLYPPPKPYGGSRYPPPALRRRLVPPYGTDPAPIKPSGMEYF